MVKYDENLIYLFLMNIKIVNYFVSKLCKSLLFSKN
jgi:hypothetical protein